MKKVFSFTLLLCSIVLINGTVFSQNTEDALRLSTPNIGIGARSLGMGTAYTGVASDFSAMFTNPAGLGQIRMNEFSLGLSNLSYNNSASYPSFPSLPSTTTSFNNSATNIDNVGLVYPFPTVRGSMVFAIGYGRNANYSTALSYGGFNPYNTMIQWLPDVNMAFGLYLTDSTGTQNDGRLYTPYVDSLQQKSKVLEGGGTNNWTVSGAVEAANNLFLGLSLNFVSGSYTYTSDYTESDIGKYSVARYGNQHALDGFNIKNTIEDDIGGFSARFGMLYRFNAGKGRLGIAVKTPTWYSITETFTSDGTAYYKVPDSLGNSIYGYDTDARTEYNISTPFVFSTGVSYTFGDFLVSGDLEYTDWTQMSFSNAAPDVMQYNTDIKSRFHATANLRGGAEYEIPNSGVRIRGGYAYLPSPYENDITGTAQKYVTAGVGFIVENSVSFDIGYAHGTWNTSHVPYSTLSNPVNVKDTAPVSTEKITTNSIIGTILYRF